jgi:hypothetical protein
MGFIESTNDNLLVLERRTESYIIMDGERKYKSELNLPPPPYFVHKRVVERSGHQQYEYVIMKKGDAPYFRDESGGTLAIAN